MFIKKIKENKKLLFFHKIWILVEDLKSNEITIPSDIDIENLRKQIFKIS